MNYEQKYKEALEKAQIYRNHLIETGDNTNEIEYIFPELINENERIWRKFIEALKECGFTHFDNEFTVQEAIDWLEKQGEQKPIEEYDVPNTPIKNTEVVTSRMKYIDDNLKPIAEFVMDYANWDLRKDVWNHPVATVPLFRVLDALVQNGKQYSEEHSVVDNNTGPKFKVGDYVVFNNGNTYQVEEISYERYELINNFGDKLSLPMCLEKSLRLWTIEDAKDGDVLYYDNLLVHGNGTLIYKADGSNHYMITKYCSVNEFGFEQNSYVILNDGYIIPSTTEQRDFLFKKMHEAGYTWDSNTKKLIKKNNYE